MIPDYFQFKKIMRAKGEYTEVQLQTLWIDYRAGRQRPCFAPLQDEDVVIEVEEEEAEPKKRLGRKPKFTRSLLTRPKLVEFMQEHPVVTWKLVAARFGLHKDTAWRALNRGAKEGWLVILDGRKSGELMRYRLAEE